MSNARFGTALFLVGEATFFLVLLMTYLFYHKVEFRGPTAADSLDPIRTGFFSAFLLGSSLTMHLAGRSYRKGQSGALRAWLLATVALGAVFLAGQAAEYSHLFQRQITIGTDLFSASFFVLTGFHGMHVLAGLALIAILFGLTWSRRVPRLHAGGVESISLYWHFVDAVWVVIFAVVYLGGML